MARQNIPNDVVVEGTLTAAQYRPLFPRAQLAQEALAEYPIAWQAWRVWDAFNTNLPGTSSGDDLALVGGTFGTGSPSLQTEDLKAAGATNKYARCSITLPPEYEAGETVVVRFRAGMLTTVADNSATIDLVAYKSDGEAGIGSDLCATAAQDINDTVLDDFDFTITPTGLAAGDVLDLRVHLAINDAATGTAVIGIIGKASLLADIRG